MFRLDAFNQAFHLQLVQCLRQVTLDPWQRQRLGRIAHERVFAAEETKENLQRHHDQLDRRRRQSAPFSRAEILADQRLRHFAHRGDFLPRRTPLREFRKRAAGRELVIFREPALRGEETDKRINLLFHAASDE